MPILSFNPASRESRKGVQGKELPLVVVVSLVESSQRRAHMTEQLTRAGIPFRFFDAMRHTNFPLEYDEATRIQMYSSHLTLGEIGCYDSHYRIWEALVHSNDDVWCVLEDDIELTSDFAQRVTSALNAPVPWGIMRLKDTGGVGGWRVKELPGGAVLHDRRKQPSGTQAYLIRRAAARTLWAYGQTMIHPVDDMMNRNWEHGIRMISLSPDIVIDRSDDLGGTTITGRRKARRTLAQKLRREFYMGRDSLSRYAHIWRRRLLARAIISKERRT